MDLGPTMFFQQTPKKMQKNLFLLSQISPQNTAKNAKNDTMHILPSLHGGQPTERALSPSQPAPQHAERHHKHRNLRARGEDDPQRQRQAALQRDGRRAGGPSGQKRWLTTLPGLLGREGAKEPKGRRTGPSRPARGRATKHSAALLATGSRMAPTNRSVNPVDSSRAPTFGRGAGHTDRGAEAWGTAFCGVPGARPVSDCSKLVSS